MTRPLACCACVAFAAVVVAIFPLGSAFTASNTVGSAQLGTSTRAVTVDERKPKPACNSVTVTNLVVGVTGTAAADLVLGGAGADAMLGRGGNDCVVGGGGNDTINGGGGTDVCIGGPGTDTFMNCETQIP